MADPASVKVGGGTGAPFARNASSAEAAGKRVRSERAMAWGGHVAPPSVVILDDGLLELEVFLLVDDALLAGFFQIRQLLADAGLVLAEDFGTAEA